MTKVELLVGVLAVVALIGLLLLLVLDKSTVVLLPILTVLVGFLVGKKSPEIASVFKKKEQV